MISLLGPVRCFTCGRVFKEEEFIKFLEISKKEEFFNFFRNYEIRNICCKKLIQTHFKIFEN